MNYDLSVMIYQHYKYQNLLGRQCLYLLLRLSLYLSGTLCHTYSFLLLAAKIMQTRQNKMNSFIFYAEAQLIFTLFAKIVNSSGTRNVLSISFSCKHERLAPNLHYLC